MIKIGEKKGGFQIKAEIGRGGMGTIYFAIDTMLNREVALKVIHSDLASNFQLMERFKVEAMTQGQMNHPNIVTVFSFNKIDDENVIAMEYIDGKNLKVLLREQKILSIADAIYYIKQILKALEYSHSRNIIHRDIKPANILIDSNNRVKLSDFGIAKVFGKQGLTKTGMLLGTPWYTPPEQIMGEKVDFRSDLYSVGITFFEMVTGKVPFDSETNSDFQVQKAHLETPPPRPSIFNPEIGSRIEKFILKALQKKPEKRFQSATEMLEAIEALEERISETVVTRSGDQKFTKIESVGSSGRKGNKLLFGILSALFACLAGAAFYFFVLKDKAPEPINIDPGPPVVSADNDEPVEPVEKEKIVEEDKSQTSDGIGSDVEKIEKKIESKPEKVPEKKPEKVIREKIKKPVRKEPVATEKKEIKKDQVDNTDVKEKPVIPDNQKLPDKVISSVNLEAELIRLRKLVELRDFKEAEKKIAGLIESGAGNPDLYSIAGGIKFIQGKFPEAEENWKSAVERGGSVVLRFYHKHGFFNKGCSGQIILKRGLIIFNSVTKRLHSFAVTSDMVKSVVKRKGNFGIEISFYVKKKVKKHVFVLRRKSREGEKFVSSFINKYILGVL
ncbi:MAG: protein kinase [Acidobacteriota bacterium]